MGTMAFNLPDELIDDIKSHPSNYDKIVKEALQSTIQKKKQDLEKWQIKEIEKGLEEAKRGEFATDEEVQTVFDKWIK